MNLIQSTYSKSFLAIESLAMMVLLSINRTVEIFLWWEGWIKISVAMVDRRQKFEKKHWLELPKAVSKKRNLDQNINFKVSYLNYFFENIILCVRFYICPDVPVKIIEFFFNFRFFNRKSQSQQILAKRITHFTIQFRAKNLTNFINLDALDVANNMLPQSSQKLFWLYKFSSKHVSV